MGDVPVTSGVTSEAQFDFAIAQINIATIPDTYTIDVNASFTLAADPVALNLPSGVTLDVVGNGNTIDGLDPWPAFFAGAGDVVISDLTIGSGDNIGIGNTVTLAPGSTLDLAGDVTFTDPIVLAGDPTITTTPGSVTTDSTLISGGGPLIVNGGGTLVLTDANTYSGGTTIQAATTLVLQGSGTAGSGPIEIDGASALVVPGTIANSIALNSGLVDDQGLIYVTGATAVAANGTLVIVSNGVTADLATSSTGTLAVTFDATGDTEVLTADALGSLVAQDLTQVASSSTQLFAAVRAVDQLSDALASIGQSAAFTIDIINNITLTQQLDAVNLGTSSSLTIVGNGDTLSGGGTYNGLFVYDGSVNIENLTIAHARAVGGNGGNGTNGGGGGAGLGGGLFVAAGGDVTLAGVFFNSDSATGGKGGNGGFTYGYGHGGDGGLDGGNGGSVQDGTSGGGGGVGLGAYGGQGSPGNGGAGIIPGAPPGGTGSPPDSSGVGGVSGGGGGDGVFNHHHAGAGIGGATGGFGGGGVPGESGGLGGGGGGAFGGGGSHFSPGGFGGGNATSSGGGGGGLGAGGDVFVQQGGTLIIAGGTLGVGTVQGGQGGAGSSGGGGGGGEGLGSGLFIQGNGSATLEPASGQTLAIAGGLADQAGNGGRGTLILDGAGTVALTAANSKFGGTIDINTGTLALTGAGTAGTGTIDLVGTGVVLLVGSGVATPTTPIAGFTGHDAEVDLGNLPYVAGAHGTIVSNTLTVISGSQTVDLHLTGGSGGLAVSSDGAGGTAVHSTQYALQFTLPQLQSFGGTLPGFALGDEITIANESFTGSDLSYDPTTGTLTVDIPGTSAATIALNPTLVATGAQFAAIPVSGGTAIVLTDTITVGNELQLNQAIATADAGFNAAYDIVFGTGTITEGTDNTGTIMLAAGSRTAPADLLAFNPGTIVTVTIDGAGGTLDGAGLNAFFAYQGDITIQNLTIADASAVGGAGGQALAGGGGGAGLGGGLFIASGADVTLNNVIFSGDSATGGAGGRGVGVGNGGGGGLDGGNGGPTNSPSFGGGGGGIGVGATGGGGASGTAPHATNDNTPGSPGIVPGAGSGDEGNPNGYPGENYTPGPGGASAGGGGEGAIVGGHGGAGGNFGGGGGGWEGYNGGFGGGGGGDDKGSGGFGGGGNGYGYYGAPAGGFGAGAGGKGVVGPGSPFYNENGGIGNSVSGGGGGGGLGGGGDIFIQQGATLNIDNGSLGAGTVNPGLGATGTPETNAPGAQILNGQNGQAFGGSMFIQGNQVVTLAPGAGQDLSIAGVISDQDGAYYSIGEIPQTGSTGIGTLAIGAGTVTLTGDNTFSGPVIVQNAGSVVVGANNALGIASATVTINATGTTISAETVPVATNIVTLEPGTGLGFSAAATIDQPITISGVPTLFADSGVTGSIAGVISGASNFFVGGSGGVTLAAANSFVGNVTVLGGATLGLTADDNLGPAGNVATLESGSTLGFADSFTLNRTIVLEGDPTFNVAAGDTGVVDTVLADGTTASNVVVNGLGTLVLETDNTYTGGTTIELGTLQLAAPTAASSGPVVFAGSLGGTLDLTSSSVLVAPSGSGTNAVSTTANNDIILNSGSIIGASGTGGAGGATGANLNGGGTLTNTGFVEGGSGDVGGWGLFLNGGSADNQAGALILGGSASGDNHGAGLGVNMGGGGLLSNEGTIVGGAGGTGDGATGVNLFPGTLTNSGLIESGVGGNAAGVYISGGTLITSGTIEANPVGAGNFAVLFAGTPGIMVVDPGARFIGAVDANTDATIELSGTEASPFSGFGTQITGLGTLEFLPNAQWTVSGNAAGLANGQIVADFAAGDTIDLTGVGNETTVTANGGGSFTFSGGGATTASMTFTGLPAGMAPGVASDGTGGTDIFLVQTTFTITTEAQLVTDTGLISQGGANAGVNFDYDFILAPPSGTIALDPLSALQLDSGAVLDVTGQGGGLNGTLSLPAAVSLLPTTSAASGLTFSDSTADLTNAALIGGAAGTGGAGGGLGVDMTAGGTLANSATIEGGAGTVGGAGVLLGGGALQNALGALIAGGWATAGSNHGYGIGVVMNGGTLTNGGTIAGGAGADGQDGATGLNLSAGSVTNTGLVVGGTGGSGGSAAGIYVANDFVGTIANSGTITGGAGVAGGEGVALNGGSLDNAAGGLILGGAATGSNLGSGLGVGLGGGALLTNEGTIEGGSSTGGDGATGVNLFTGTLVNAGFIEGGAGGASAGVYISGGRLITSGTIAANPVGAGNEAVLFSGAGTMVVDPGAVFFGAVEANTADTIELAGTAAGTLDGFGTQITGLGTLLFDPQAQWTVAGNAHGLAGNQVLSGFAPGDTIDLTGVGHEVTVTPDSPTSYTLTGSPNGAGATAATLTFAAPLPVNEGLALASDGAMGTLVWLVQTGTPSISAPATAILGVSQPGSLGTISIAESPTSTSETFTLTLSDGNGQLSANTTAPDGGGTITPSNGGTTLTIAGSLAQVNADLTTLTDTDATTGSDTVSLNLSDSNGGNASAASIEVGINGLPTISLTSGDSVSVTQNQASAIGDAFTLAETGNTTTSGETFSLVVSDASGTLAANTSVTNGGGTITPSDGDETLTFAGTLQQINADLTTLTDTESSTSNDTLTVSASDSFGNSTASATTLGINVTAAPITFDVHVYLDANGDGMQDDGESGLAGVTVDLLNGSGQLTGESETTDASGDASFTGLAPGSYEVSVENPEGDRVSQATNLLTPNALTGGQTASATEGVYVPATFSVFVYDDKNADGTFDAGDIDISGQPVDLLNGSGAPTGQATTTNASGIASFTDLAPGTYEVAVPTTPGDVVTQSVNTNTPNTLASGGSASATFGEYAPPALTQSTLSLTVAEGRSLGNLWSELIANGVDPHPSTLSITAVGTGGTQGSVSLDTATQTLTYIATGLDPTEPVNTFTYTLTDGSGGTVTGTVDVTVTGPNLPTTAAMTPGSTTTATGSGQRLISAATGQTLDGSPAGGDELFGGSNTSINAAGNGNSIFVTPGNHYIAMGASNNTVTLYDGNNTVTATGSGNTVTGGNGNNTVTGMTGSSTITLGNGTDTVTLTGADNSVTVGTGPDHISAGNGGGETVIAGDGANTITAGGADDSITAGNGANKITATGAGATILAGNGGNAIAASGAGDQITSGSGNDTIQTTAGNAIIKAGLGLNTIRFAGSGNDIINQGGTDTLTDSGTGNTIVLPLAGKGMDTINGPVLTNSDTFDLRAALVATTWDQQLSDLGDYLTLGTQGSNTLVQLSNISGHTPITVAILEGAGAVSLSSFVSHALLT